MLDYHLHLWPHEESTTWLDLDQIAAYCERARAEGVEQLALTEHLHRFRQFTPVMRRHLERTSEDAAVNAEMARYFDTHARSDLDAYVALCAEAKAAGLPVVIGLEVDYYEGQMDEVSAILAQYPFDVLLGSVHWIGAWQLDDIDNAVHMARWEASRVDACWEAYTAALEELAATGACDVLAHPDLVKVAGYVPGSSVEWWDRIAEAAASSSMSAEVSSAGWFKPIGEQYPAVGLLERFARRGVSFTTASDAHRVGHVARRAGDLRAVLSDAGVTSLASYDARRRVDVPLDGAR